MNVPRYLCFFTVAAALCIAHMPALACKSCDPTIGCTAITQPGQSGWLFCTWSPSAGCNGAHSCTVGGTCFIAGTWVQTPSGPVKIETLQIGDLVVSVDDQGRTTFATVTATHRALANEYQLINGRTGVTAEHPVRAGTRWVQAGKLKTGDVMTCYKGEETVVRVETITRGVRVYNLEVDGTHVFYANDMLVHNKQWPGDD